MKISISAQTFSLDDYINLDVLESGSNYQDLSRRVNKTATLDTGINIQDNGWSHGDRTFTFQANVTQEQYNTLYNLNKNYYVLTLTTPDGAYQGNLSQLKNEYGLVTITFMVESSLSEWEPQTTTTTSTTTQTSSFSSSCSTTTQSTLSTSTSSHTTISSTCTTTHTTSCTSTQTSSTTSITSQTTQTSSCSSSSTESTQSSTKSTLSSTSTSTTRLTTSCSSSCSTISTISTQSSQSSTKTTVSSTCTTQTSETTHSSTNSTESTQSTTHTSSCTSTQTSSCSTESTQSSTCSTESSASTLSTNSTTSSTPPPPTEGTFYPSQSSDDWVYNASSFNNSDSTDDIGRDGGGTWIWSWGCIFKNVNIPNGATIDSAKITITAGDSDSGTNTAWVMVGQDEDTATTPTQRADVVAFNLTTATVAWNGEGAWTTDNTYDSPDIKTIIKEIVDRGGWVSGNDIQIMVKENGSTNGAFRNFSNIDRGASYKAALYVDWS